MTEHLQVPDGAPQLAGPALRLGALLADLRVVYPCGTLRAGAIPTGPTGRSFRLLPSRRTPRMLVPVGSGTAVRHAVLRASANDSWRDSLLRRGVTIAAAGPLGPLLFPHRVSVEPVGADSLEAHLEAAVGQQVRVSIHGGAQRANAKPVLGVFSIDGSLLGFAKIGVTPLASRLVASETAALQRLAAARPREFDVPAVVSAGSWRGHVVLVMDALRGERGLGQTLPVSAMQELAALAGTRVHTWRESPWAAAVRERTTGAVPAVATRLRDLLDRLVDRHADLAVAHGAAHGDWGPWNMSWRDNRPQVWDWERFALDVPIGCDAVHFTAHARLRRIGDMHTALAVLRADGEAAVRSVLAAWPTHSPPGRATSGSSERARAVVDAYLVEIACRLGVDAHQAGTPSVARLADWYLAVAAARLDAGRSRVATVTSGTLP